VVDGWSVLADDTRRAIVSRRLTIAVGFEGHGIGKIHLPLLVRRQAQKEMPANLATLKRRIEAQRPQTGP
jgi:hypothetical protein